MTECTFCTTRWDRWREETVFYEDELIVIARAKDLKGHKERLIALLRLHKVFNEGLEIYLTAKLKEVGTNIFKRSFIILEDTFSRFPGHAHKIACLLDLKADDYQQILNTEFTHVRL